MVNANDGLEPEAPIDRRELERIAFARPRTDADASAADDALRRLANADEQAATESSSSGPPATSDGGAPDEPDVAGAIEPPARFPRRLLPLIVALAVVVALGAGVEIGRATVTPAVADPSGTVTSRTVVPAAATAGDSTAALAALATTQTPADVFPIPSFVVSLGLEPKTVHLILTGPDGNSLWIGRTSAAICLLFSDPQEVLANDDLDPSLANAGSNCATTEAFQTSGLTVSNGPDRWTWNGATFTTGTTRG